MAQVLRNTGSARYRALPFSSHTPHVSPQMGALPAPTPTGDAVLVFRGIWHLGSSERSGAARPGQRCDVATGALALLEDQPGAAVSKSDRGRVYAHGSGTPWGEANRRWPDGGRRKNLVLEAVERRGGGHRPAPFELGVHALKVSAARGSEFGRTKGDEMARASSCFAEAEETLIDIQVAETRYLENDGKLDDREKLALFPLLQKLRGHNEYMVPTGLFVATAVTGGRGIFSEWSERCWKESRKQRKDNIVQLFPETGDAA